MFKQMTLQARIFLAFAFMGLLVLTISLIGWTTNLRLSEHINLVGNNAFFSVLSLGEINENQTQIQAVQRVLINPISGQDVRRKELNIMEKALEQIEVNLKNYAAIKREIEEEELYQTFLKDWEKWVVAYKEVMRLYEGFEKYDILNPAQVQLDLLQQRRENSSEMAAAKAASRALDKIIDYAFNQEAPAFATAEESLLQLLTYNKSLATEGIKKANQDVSQSSFWVIMGMALGPIAALIFGIYFSIAITRPVKQSAIAITSSTTQIAASGRQLEAMMTEQVASTHEVVATAKEIAATSEQLVRTMDEVAEMASATTTAAGSGQKDIQRMETTMRQLADATSSIAAKLGVISEKANNINSVVMAITKVADRTNLLSLNAAIEAEKAGEYGLGFAVVAREIRRLADQTAIATLDIEQMVKEMQSSVSTGVMEMDKFTKEVGRTVEDVRNISGQLAEIISQVQSLTPRFEEVNKGMESQSIGARQISEAMIQLSEASSQTADSLREINGAIAQLNEAAQSLRREVLALK